MSLAQELSGGSSDYLFTRFISSALHNHSVEEIARFIRSSEDFEGFWIDCPPVNEELGRHISDAVVQNAHIKRLVIDNDLCFYDFFDEFVNSFAIPDFVAWIASRNTLVNMTNLESVVVCAFHDMSVLDCSALFPLLLTSTSLRKFEIIFASGNECSDDVMSALLTYIGTGSLREFEFLTLRGLSEAAFTALCNGVTLSTVRQITLYKSDLQNFDPETAAESLARMIVESSLEEVSILEGRAIWSIWRESLISALKLTTPVRNMDFAFTRVVDVTRGNRTTSLMINRKWKPLVIGANTPLALWPHILQKSHSSPETSHGSADIVFYVLRQKPDLVPAP